MSKIAVTKEVAGYITVAVPKWRITVARVAAATTNINLLIMNAAFTYDAYCDVHMQLGLFLREMFMILKGCS